MRRVLSSFLASAATALALGSPLAGGGARVACADPAVLGEALWLRDPSISPDGTRIAFTYRGDVWVVASAGGRAYPLTTHEACDKRPCWSPDGRTVAFASDRYGNFDVFVVPADGGVEKRLTFHESSEIPTSFTPDGKSVVFTGRRQDDPASSISGWWPQTWAVPVEGGRPTMVLTTPALNARWSADGTRLVYEDLKSYENAFRKHHVSSAARDVWVYDPASGKHTCMTRSFRGEDRDGWLAADGRLWFTSERGGSMNVYVADGTPDAPATAVTDHQGAPVRSLSVAKDGTIAYSFDGALWTKKPGQPSRRLKVDAPASSRVNADRIETETDGATEMAVSPDGEEVALVVRGDVFVASVKYGTTRRITDTATPERDVAWSKDGKRLYYAGERDGSWNLYFSTIARKEEKKFCRCTKLGETVLLATPDEEFAPVPSPDGKHLAYVRERDEIDVLDLETNKTRVVLPSDRNYSYEDGDLTCRWSPDGRWLACEATDAGRWIGTVVVVDVLGKDGKTEPTVDVARSGYEEHDPVWSGDGRMLTFLSDRFGRRAHGSWGAEDDVIGVLLTRAARDRFRLTQEEFEEAKAEEEKAKEEAKDEKDAKEGDEKDAGDAAMGDGKEPSKDGKEPAKPKKDDGSKDGKDGGGKGDAPKNDDKPKKEKDKGDKGGKGGKDADKADDDEKPAPVEVETDLLEERTVRLTRTSAPIASHAVSPDGETVLLLAHLGKTWGLFATRPRMKDSIGRLASLGDKDPKKLELTKDGKTALVLDGDGKITKYDVSAVTGDEPPEGDSSAEGKSVDWSADVRIRSDLERESMFDHVAREVAKKFYDPKLHGVDWPAITAHYRAFLPNVAEGEGFAELLSEMLGELNASHTGAHRTRLDDDKDKTASLGLLFDVRKPEAGLRIAEVLPGGPSDKAKSALLPGALIVAVDGITLGPSTPLEPILNRKAGKSLVVRAVGKDGGEPFEEVVKPVSLDAERELLYHRWTRGREALVEKLSGGRIGYVHVKDMDDAGYRHVFQDVLGKSGTKEALIVDTRFNGGGWLHDDLVSFLSGHDYAWFVPRGKTRGTLGAEPRTRWSRPAAIVVNESNYSDAHFFPAAVQALKLAPIVGAPIAGTATAVWWETLVDPEIVFGIPQVGMQSADGRYLENNELRPDVEVYDDPESVAKGDDPQIAAAVKLLLDRLGAK